MRKPAPDIDHPYVFSVSQAETFELCPRKWAYLKIDGLEDPGNEASALGGEVHDQLEHYLEKGRPINVRRNCGRIAMAGVKHLPPPRYPGMKIEEWFYVKIGNHQGKHGVGAYYRGLKDVSIRKGWKSHRPFVSDHKTTKALTWAKSAYDLTGGETGIGDTQAGVYAYDDMITLNVDEVDLQWTYMLTTGPARAEPTETIITREQVNRIITKLEVTTARMIDTKDNHPTAETVEQDFTGCAAFGGCPFRDKCNPTANNQITALFSQWRKQEDNMAKETGVLAKLAARKEAKKGGGKAPSKPQTVETTGEETTDKNPQLSVVKENESTTSEVNPPENAEAPEVTEEEARAKKGRGKGSSSRKKQTPAAPKASEPVAASSGSVLGRAVDAFWGVIVDDLAARIAEKLKK